MEVIFEGNRYIYNGRNLNGLGVFCYEVFKKYLNENIEINYFTVKEIFNNLHCSNNRIIQNEEEFSSLSDNQKERYFNPILHGNMKLYFSTQWGNNGIENGKECNNINHMVDFAREQGYDIEVIQDNDFYGLWISRKDQEKIDECLNTGVWQRGTGNFNREYEVKKIESMNKGDRVFLYKNIPDIRLKDTPFVQYLNPNTYNLSREIVKVKSLGTGTVVSADSENLSVNVVWDDDFKSNEWYIYFRQDGVWWFDGKTQNKNDAKELYGIVFNGKVQDYKRWANSDYFKKFKIDKGDYSTMNIKNIILYGSPGVGKTHNTNKLISLIEDGSNEQEIFKAIKENEEETILLSEDIKSRTKFITFHQSFGYEDFIEGFRPNEDGNITLSAGIFKTICEDAYADIDNKYYLVIDEINRGNISKIFGELITLIEEDKRDKLEVTLPYSKKSFKIPSNLYIIGTMNSTDKSIALIDIALRRRFTFLKMKPNAELIKYDDAKQIFISLNEKIKETIGEDYQIGHSYFMKVQNAQDLNFVLEYKIIPLLEEYYYGDEDGFRNIQEILEKRN